MESVLQKRKPLKRPKDCLPVGDLLPGLPWLSAWILCWKYPLSPANWPLRERSQACHSKRKAGLLMGTSLHPN